MLKRVDLRLVLCASREWKLGMIGWKKDARLLIGAVTTLQRTPIRPKNNTTLRIVHLAHIIVSRILDKERFVRTRDFICNLYALGDNTV